MTLVTTVICTCRLFCITDTEQQSNLDAASGRYVLTLDIFVVLQFLPVNYVSDDVNVSGH